MTAAPGLSPTLACTCVQPHTDPPPEGTLSHALGEPHLCRRSRGHLSSPLLAVAQGRLSVHQSPGAPAKPRECESRGCGPVTHGETEAEKQNHPPTTQNWSFARGGASLGLGSRAASCIRTAGSPAPSPGHVLVPGLRPPCPAGTHERPSLKAGRPLGLLGRRRRFTAPHTPAPTQPTHPPPRGCHRGPPPQLGLVCASEEHGCRTEGLFLSGRRF